MRRLLIIFALLILLPAALLAVFAFGAADRDHEAELERLDATLADEADALVRRIEAALADARGRAERAILALGAPAAAAGDAVVGLSRQGAWSGYALSAPAGASAAAADPVALRLYALSVRGGESYELGSGDPKAALDAYAFYVPRLRDPALRARLRFRMARAAFAAGETALGAALARDLVATGAGTFTEEDLPIDLLAADMLAGRSPGGGAADAAIGLDAAALARRILDAAPHLSTALLERFATTFAPADTALGALVERRRALERAIAARPAILAARDAVLVGDALLVARDLPSRDGLAAWRAITLVPVAFPALAAGAVDVRLIRDATEETGPVGPARVERPVRAGENGPEVARLEVRDPGHDVRVRDLESRRARQRQLVALLALATFGGLGALVFYVRRERLVAALRTRLLANVSHELKTPVTSIRMLSEMLAEESFDPERVRRYGQLLHSESLRLSHITENVLDFASLEHAKGELPREPVDLAALLARIGDGFAPRARAQGFVFTLEGLLVGADGEAEGGPVAPPATIVMTNAAAVERIVTNLLDNALKYGRGKRNEIILGLARDGDLALVGVTDHGPGIPARERDKVFEAFYRLGWDDYAVQGAGLGLSIARALARRLGGDLRLEARQGRDGAGCVFTLALPAARTPDDESAPAVRGAPRPRAAASEAPREESRHAA